MPEHPGNGFLGTGPSSMEKNSRLAFERVFWSVFSADRSSVYACIWNAFVSKLKCGVGWCWVRMKVE